MSGVGRVRASARLAATVCCAVLLGLVAVVFAALAVGYRPVVITTGSMGETAPPGSLAVAAPRAGDDIDVGDVVVMRHPGSAPITHRVIEIEDGAAGRFAITQGDANPTADAIPYALGGEELVARWVVPRAGSLLAGLRDPRVALAVLAALLAGVTALALRRIWAGAPSEPSPERSAAPSMSAVGWVIAGPGGERVALVLLVALVAAGTAVVLSRIWAVGPTDARRQRTRAGVVVAIVAVVAGAGIAWALYGSNHPVDANAFTTAECFDPQLRSVQSGVTVHAVDGTVTESITAVDPSQAFVMASVRSASTEPADSSVRVTLAGATTVELVRRTDAATPPPVTVAWSVVEYGCGVTVQRGVVAGDGTNRLDVAISSVDPSASFVVAGGHAPATASAYGPDDLAIVELSAPDTLTIRGSATASFDGDRSFAWQVVTFTDPAAIDVQTVSGTLAVGAPSTTITLPDPVDVDATFVTAAMTSDATGPDVGERLVRAWLVDESTLAVDRAVAGDAVEVVVQVVALADGTTVRHGTVDLPGGTASRTVALASPVDATRSTASSTVAVPGPLAGGMTDHVVDDTIGEASATFGITDPSTVTVVRDTTASNASFGWQVIEWAGPSWWDPDYAYRRRIDVDASTVDAPDGYTVPLGIDHADLVASGIARADGDDLRVLRWDGTAWTELDRVLDDDSAWERADTTIWFRTTDPIAAGSTQTYWLYLGNPAAGPAPSDPEAVYLLVEDFETGLGDFEDRTGTTGWYAADPWTRRVPVTVPAGTVASTLTDFPLLVSLTSVDLAANARADGSDVRFTAGDGTTPLAHEIERFDSGTGALVAWVRLPSLAAGSATTIYLYYGAADAPSQEDVRGTWPGDVEAVWHLARDPSGSAPQLDDSSARNHDGLSLGTMTSADLVEGLVGASVDLDGADDALVADTFGLAGASGLTVSGWARLDAYTVDAHLFAAAAGATDEQVGLAVRSDGSVRARLLLDGGMVEATTAPGTVSLGAWQHVAMTWDGTDLGVVVDGTSRASVAAPGAIDPRSAMSAHLGNVATEDRPLDGRLDEVRVETTARSLAWLAAAEANQRTPAAFVTVGAVETGTWFDQGAWSHRKPIVVGADQVTADVTDFPLLVQVVDAELQASAQACACDLVFTGADGTTRLDHLVEAYDPGTGALTAWVSVPVLSGTEDTQLFLYYGNPTAVDQQDPPAVFGSDADLRMTGAP